MHPRYTVPLDPFMAQGVLSVCGEATSRPVKSLKNASSPSRHHALTHTNTRFKIEEKKEYPDEFKWGQMRSGDKRR